MACTIDFRCLDEGFGGKTYKRKRSQESSEFTLPLPTSNDFDSTSMELDNPPPAKRAAIPSSSDPSKPVYGKPTYDGMIAGKVSGRNWKTPRQRASSRVVSRKRATYEERMKEREIKKAFSGRKEELKEEIRRNKEEKRKKREEREKKKKENVLRSGTKLQKITNPKTLNKIRKSKHGKLLKFIPDNLLKK